jgi:hypothetical protein
VKKVGMLPKEEITEQFLIHQLKCSLFWGDCL